MCFFFVYYRHEISLFTTATTNNVSYTRLSACTAPLMKFPMDEAHGKKVLGYFNGTLEGSASLVTGNRGRALYIDGQQSSHVAYGTYTEGCFFDLDQCNQGITIAFWLALPEMPAYATFFQQWRMFGQYITFFGHPCSFVLGVTSRAGSQLYIYNFKQPVTSVWNSFIITYFSGDIKVFVNGCNGEPDSSKYSVPDAISNPADSAFYISNLPNSGDKVHLTVDELMVWYKVLTEDEIWDLYVQGA